MRRWSAPLLLGAVATTGWVETLGLLLSPPGLRSSFISGDVSPTTTGAPRTALSGTSKGHRHRAAALRKHDGRRLRRGQGVTATATAAGGGCYAATGVDPCRFRTRGFAPAGFEHAGPGRSGPQQQRSRRPSLAVASVSSPGDSEGGLEDGGEAVDGGARSRSAGSPAGVEAAGDFFGDDTAPTVAGGDFSPEESGESQQQQQQQQETASMALSSDSPATAAGKPRDVPSPTTARVFGGGDGDGAEGKAEAVLRKLSSSELAGMKPRLGLDPGLEGDEEIIARAVPILAERIRAKSASQEVGRSTTAAAEIRPPQAATETKTTSPKPAVALSPAEQASGGFSPQGDWAGGAADEGVTRGWVGEKGSRRWVGAPGEKPPRQRHANREPEPPLAPGQRSYFATCPRGLETVLRDELMSPLIGATLVKSSGRGCHFRGDQAVGYKAILWLRTAHRVLELVGEGGSPLGAPIDGAESLYGAAAAVPWSRFMRQGQTLSVDAILGVVPDGLTHSHFTALTVKNAVVDQLRDNGQRPSVNTDNPDLPLVVYLDRGRALLYRSLSGTRSMHKRGYRDAMHAASLKENVAAGLLLASGWDPETQGLADPMCGSGTLVIEAALIALRRAPGLVAMGAYGGGKGGRGWAKEAGWKPAVTSWPDFDAVLWRETVGEALQLQRARPPAAIMGNDWHHGALSLAWRDAKAAGVEDCVTLFDEDVSRWRPPSSVDLAVTNPPWDHRLDRDAENSWHGLLEFLRREVAEKDAWVLSGNPALSRVLRMKSEQNIFLATGGVELRWLKYHLNEYRGDRGRRGKGAGGGGPRPRKVSRMNDRPAIDRW